MKMQNIENKVYNCPLSWWKLSAYRFKNLERLAVKYLAIPATAAPSERIWSRAARVLTVKRNRMSEEITSALIRGCTHKKTKLAYLRTNKSSTCFFLK